MQEASTAPAGGRGQGPGPGAWLAGDWQEGQGQGAEQGWGVSGGEDVSLGVPICREGYVSGVHMCCREGSQGSLPTSLI